MTTYLEETEEQISESGLAQPAVVAKGVSKAKRMRAICLVAIPVLGVFFALRSQKPKGDPAAAGEANNSVIIQAGTAHRGDMRVYINALGTVTPVSTINIFSQVSGQVLAVHYRKGQIVNKGDPLIDTSTSIRVPTEPNCSRPKAYSITTGGF
jgi:membrane fusion protein, multidrug efflux system